MTHHILLLPGDGIGPEVVSEAALVLKTVVSKFGLTLEFDEALIGGAAYDAYGTPFPDETLAKAKMADAILLGAVGGPKWESLDISVRPERGLLGLRKELELFANLRPCICFDALADASTLKREIIAGLDILIVRELTGGLYFGEPKGVEDLLDGQKRGYNTLTYTTSEIERIARVAFDLARKRSKREPVGEPAMSARSAAPCKSQQTFTEAKPKVYSIDKANVLIATELWRNVVNDVHAKHYPDCELNHMYVDNAAMQLVRNPKQFDVVVTTNMFGDILSDIGAQLTGSLGMLPSASLGKEGTPGVFEPVHGSAPDIAGQNLANPIATILSAAMLLRYSLNQGEAADAIENAVEKTLADGLRTADIMQDGMTKLSTKEMGAAILERVG